MTYGDSDVQWHSESFGEAPRRFQCRVATGSDDHAYVIIDTDEQERTVVFGSDDYLEVEAEAEARNAHPSNEHTAPPL